MSMSLNGSIGDQLSGVRIQRASATIAGFQPSVDPVVKSRLRQLDALLGRRVVPTAKGPAKTLVTASLTPHRAQTENKDSVNEWADRSLARLFHDAREDSKDRTLTDYIDGDATLANLSYSFDDQLDERRSELDLEVRAILDYPNIRKLLVVRGYLGLNITQATSLMNFVLTHGSAATSFVSYGVVSAARDYVEENQLRVRGIDNDTGDAVRALVAGGIGFNAATFEDAVVDVLLDYSHEAKFDGIFEASGIDVDKLPQRIKPKLIEYIQTSIVPVTEDNAPFWVPMYVDRASKTGPILTGGTGGDAFAVTFFEDDSQLLEISTAAVQCASQLYYVMTLGDELGTFDAVRQFTHRYLFRDGFAVEDPQLRRDLENYVFSEQFPGVDELTGGQRMMRCTRPAERRSFYRQVFNQGKEPVPGDGMANTDFSRLWKILMLESARYLEKAQISPHPDNFVPRQNVMQAVEDLQYNLSTSCVGMATVMTPLMYAELDFVVTRILNHPEVRKHVAPSGGSWLKVVERLLAGQGRRARVSVENNKARIGYTLIRMIAEYTPGRFEQDDRFSTFISNVDGFITTQSILQEEAAGPATGGDEGDEPAPDDEYGNDYGTGEASRYPEGGGYGNGSMPGMPDLSHLPGMPSIPGVSAPWPGSGAPAGGNGNGNGSSMSPAGDAGPSSGEWDF